jgi:hypothetical protein
LQRRDHAELDQQHLHDRHLEGEAETEEDRQREVPVLLQILHDIGAGLRRERKEELVGRRQHEGIGEGDADAPGRTRWKRSAAARTSLSCS